MSWSFKTKLLCDAKKQVKLEGPFWIKEMTTMPSILRGVIISWQIGLGS